VIVYLDTSAFVKLVVDESGDADARAWFDTARMAFSSVVTYAEACAAVGRRDRMEGPDEARLRAWVAEIDDRWRRTVTIPVAARRAGQLALVHRLRGMDAVQLAAAVTLRDRLRAGATGEPAADVAFAAFDRRLLEAAEREGFATLGGPLE
jgi:predicted nucleic acid-binding protein